MTSVPGKERRRGFQEAMRGAGIPIRSEWMLAAGFQPEQGRGAAYDLLAGVRRPTAIVVANVNAAVGAMHGARELGVDVPKELSIIGIHDTWSAEYLAPGLTTVRMPLYELGREAVQMLVEAMNGRRANRVVITDPAPLLVVRASTGPPPTR